MGLRGTLRRIRSRDVPDWFAKRKLLRGIRELGSMPAEQLRDERALVEVIRRVGLKRDTRGVYGDESRYMNFTNNGLWQVPQQMAEAMVALSRHEIGTFLEVGTHSGYTFSLLAAYLLRFNPGLKALTIDPFPHFRHHREIARLLPIEYRHCTSDDLRGQAFDLVFIDGDHDYAAAALDFENVGRHARVCMFHDIHDDLVGFENVPRLWGELVGGGRFGETHEFLQCTPGKRVMGIGVGVRAA